jgi:2-polyprenyl-3-methyl-5-hydroxy-6-metoxy-1,4-benzoquinol methylase
VSGAASSARAHAAVAWRVAAELPPAARAYALVRFGIVRPNLLAPMDALLPAEGRILEVGCGYGLFAAWFATRAPGRRIVAVDRDERRVALAAGMARRLGLAVEFRAEDARQLPAAEPFDAAYALDVLHHVPRAAHEAVLADVSDRLRPGGTLLVKEIATAPRWRLEFTRALDRLMAPDDELSYRAPEDWARLLDAAGFDVRTHPLPDVLPYPHVLLACTRRQRA